MYLLSSLSQRTRVYTLRFIFFFWGGGVEACFEAFLGLFILILGIFGGLFGALQPIFAHAYPVRAPDGICYFLWSGMKTDQIPVQAQSNPVGCPDWDRVGWACPL